MSIKPLVSHTSRRSHISAMTSIAVLVTGGFFALPQVQVTQTFKPQASKAFVQALTDKASHGSENALISYHDRY